MRAVLTSVRRLFRRCLGYSDCPLCGAQAVRWRGENPIHPDGPPLVEWFQCEACGARTDDETPLLDKASREFGHENFAAFLKVEAPDARR